MRRIAGGFGIEVIVAAATRSVRSVLAAASLALSALGACSPVASDDHATVRSELTSCPPLVDGSSVVGERKRLVLSAPEAAPAAIIPYAEGVIAASTLRATATVSDLPGVTHGPFVYFLRYAIDIIDDACTPLRSIELEVPAPSPGAYSLAATWDGRDDAGARVPAGTYFFTVSASYVKRHGVSQIELVRDSATSSVGAIQITGIVPRIECVQRFGLGYSAALIGYENPAGEAVVVASGVDNHFVGLTAESSPNTFEPGVHAGVGWIEFASVELTWHLGDTSVTASDASRPCERADFATDADAEPPPGVVDPTSPGPLPPHILGGIPPV